MTLSPAASWAFLAILAAATLGAVLVLARLDRVWSDALERRRDRVRGFDEEYAYRRAREAVARQTRSSNVRIGHRDTREENPNE